MKKRHKKEEEEEEEEEEREGEEEEREGGEGEEREGGEEEASTTRDTNEMMRFIADEIRTPFERFLRAKHRTFGVHLDALRRRGGDGTNNTLYDTKDAVLDCSAYLKIVFGALLGMAYAKMQTVGFAHFIVGGVVLGSIPMVLSQHWLKHPPEKSIEWGGPFALASDGIGAGLASLVLTWSVCHSAWNA